MENLTVTQDLTSSEIAKFNVTNLFLLELKEKFLPLKINGIDDDAGYSQVKEAKKFVQSKRTEVEKKRKELKDDYLRTGQAIDKEAKRITTEIVIVESHLDSELKTVDDKKATLKLEKENLERLPIRKMTLAEIGMELPDSEILSMDATSWSIFIMNEKERIMMEQKAKLDAQQIELDKKQAVIDLQNRIDAEKRQAVIDTENRIKADIEAKEKQEQADKIKAEKKAQRAPDKVKLQELANKIADMDYPDLKSEDAQMILNNVDGLLNKVVTYINNNIQNL